MTDYGFTGSSEATTLVQLMSFREFVPASGMTKFRHGDCIMADHAAHEIVRRVLPNVPIHGHPPSRDVKRAFCDTDEQSKPKPYLDRNRDIVFECDELLAMPKDMTEQERGGTWYTIRQARLARKPITIFWPDGSVTREPA
jgi:hypothetical protein